MSRKAEVKYINARYRIQNYVPVTRAGGLLGADSTVACPPVPGLTTRILARHVLLLIK